MNSSPQEQKVFPEEVLDFDGKVGKFIFNAKELRHHHIKEHIAYTSLHRFWLAFIILPLLIGIHASITGKLNGITLAILMGITLLCTLIDEIYECQRKATAHKALFSQIIFLIQEADQLREGNILPENPMAKFVDIKTRYNIIKLSHNLYL